MPLTLWGVRKETSQPNEEIKTIAGLHKHRLWLLRPVGSTFIYFILAWFLETPITDDDKWFPSSERCPEFHSSGRRCVNKVGHKRRHRIIDWHEF